MKRKLHTPEQIVKKLREADAAIASGTTVEQVCRHLMAGGAGVEWYFGYKFAHNDRGKDWVALIKRKTTK